MTKPFFWAHSTPAEGGSLRRRDEKEGLAGDLENKATWSFISRGHGVFWGLMRGNKGMSLLLKGTLAKTLREQWNIREQGRKR